MTVSHRYSTLTGVCLCMTWLASLCLTGQALEGAEEPAPGVVVLTDGRIYTGLVVEVGGGYRVDAAGQFIVVPFERVKVTARSTHDAYEKLRDSVKQPVVEDHLRLAEWCWANQLPGEAHTEVVQALKLDPLRTEARQLFQKIESQYAPAGNAASGPAAPQPALPMAAFTQQESGNKAGLSRSLMEDYVRKVQPLLMNKCGNANCHGQASNREFRLVNTRVGAGNYKSATESNLEMLAKFVDGATPASSPLLRKSLEPAGPHQRVFGPEQPVEQRKLLEAFVEHFVQEHRSGGTVLAQAPQPVSPPALIPPPQDVPPAPIQPVAGEMPAAADRRNPPVEETRLFLDRIRQEMLPDAFDPEVFNRKVHGAAAAELRGRRR